MALKLSYRYPTGHTGDYFKILQIALDAHNKKATVFIGLFKDQAARDALDRPMHIFQYPVTGAEYNNAFTPDKLKSVDMEPYQEAYKVIKTRVDADNKLDFTKAVDA